ncbi:hypothetical protein KCU83_g479, partial [Aureobasidium melanogenum]
LPAPSVSLVKSSDSRPGFGIQEQNTICTDRRPDVVRGRLHRITRDLISEFERIFLLLRDQAGVIDVLLLVVSATIEFNVRPVVNSAFSSSNLSISVA